MIETRFKFVTPSAEHEQGALEFLAACEAAGNINGDGCLNRYKDDYKGWLDKLARDRNQVADAERVPAETFFLARESSGRHHVVSTHVEEIVGIFNIRLALNWRLVLHSGSIGYMIHPNYRNKGYAKIGLFLALTVCQNRDLEAVLLSCFESNPASAHVIRALGGKFVFKASVAHGETLVQYVIDIDRATSELGSQYLPLLADYPG